MKKHNLKPYINVVTVTTIKIGVIQCPISIVFSLNIAKCKNFKKLVYVLLENCMSKKGNKRKYHKYLKFCLNEALALC